MTHKYNAQFYSGGFKPIVPWPIDFAATLVNGQLK